MVKHGKQSFCCGAGGAQMWKEEEHGTSRVSAERIRQAKEVGADTLAVGCPFCMIMLTDAAKAEAPNLLVRDVVEIIVDNLK
jgi:Fe-S oxidoreductase